MERALSRLDSQKLLRSLRPILPSKANQPGSEETCPSNASVSGDDFEVFDGLRQWDRASVEVMISETTYRKWLKDVPSSGNWFCFASFCICVTKGCIFLGFGFHALLKFAFLVVLVLQ